jgi:phage shock protein C
MAEQTKSKSTSRTGTATLEFNEFELNSTMQDFLNEEEKDTGNNIWNIATISGMVMIFLASTFAIQSIGLPVGEFLSGLSQGLVGSSVLPLLGGALITLVGFGFLVGDRKRTRKSRKERKKAKAASASLYTDIPGSEDQEFIKKSKLKNALDSKSGKTYNSSASMDFDAYGYRNSKRLMKSRTDKKWAGVCGGLAKYFGISSTVVRVLFVATAFFGSGASILIYLGLSLAMPKEPIDMMDDFDY